MGSWTMPSLLSTFSCAPGALAAGSTRCDSTRTETQHQKPSPPGAPPFWLPDSGPNAPSPCFEPGRPGAVSARCRLSSDQGQRVFGSLSVCVSHCVPGDLRSGAAGHASRPLLNDGLEVKAQLDG